MKLRTLEWILLTSSLCGCRTHQTTIFVEQTLNRDYAKIACDIYKRNHNITCLRTPDQMTTDLQARLTLAVLQNPACKHVTISYTPVSEEKMKDYLAGWSLTFDVGIDDRDIDYSNSAWHMLDHKTKKRFDGPLRNSADDSTQICLAALR
jgi:hypothetical protein